MLRADWCQRLTDRTSNATLSEPRNRVQQRLPARYAFSADNAVRYRSANLDDARLLARMNAQLIADEGHRNPMTVDQLAQRMSHWLGSGAYEAVLFEADDPAEPLGYALFRRDPDCVYLRQFFVARSKRRGGVGREAFAWLRNNMWRDGKRIRVEALIGNASAIAFWHDVGFGDYSLTMELNPQD